MSSIHYNPSYNYYTSSSSASLASSSPPTNTSSPTNALASSSPPTNTSSPTNALASSSPPEDACPSDYDSDLDFGHGFNCFSRKHAYIHGIDRKGVFNAIKTGDLNSLRSYLSTPTQQANVESAIRPLSDYIVYAAQKGYFDVCEYLLSLGSESGRLVKANRLIACIRGAAESGNSEAFQYFLSDPLEFFPIPPPKMAPPLLRAPLPPINEEEEELVTYLLSKRHSAETLRSIARAIERAHLNIAEIFLEKCEHALKQENWDCLLGAAIRGADVKTIKFFWKLPKLNIPRCLTRATKEKAMSHLLDRTPKHCLSIMQFLLTQEPAVSERLLLDACDVYAIRTDKSSGEKIPIGFPMIDWLSSNRKRCKTVSGPPLYEDSNIFSLEELERPNTL